jgi:uncharacterized protein YnzC (UPF0291/DUF896 family)
MAGVLLYCMEKEKIDRINELSHKAKNRELTAEEISEREALRQEYLAAVRANLQASCDNIYIVDKDGNKNKLQKKH